MKVTLTLPPELFNALRLTSIHRNEDIAAVIAGILKQYYDTRKD